MAVIEAPTCGAGKNPNAGRHAWFKFTAEVGHMYFVSTVLVEGGLEGAEVAMHLVDSEQTQIGKTVSNHCPSTSAEENNIGYLSFKRACMVFECTASGEYAVRLSQTKGSGAVRVLVQDKGDLTFWSERDGTAIEGTPSVAAADTWAMELGLDCSYLYCRYWRSPDPVGQPLASSGGQQISGDGSSFVMKLNAPAAGHTYYFSLGVSGGDAASVKMTIYPKQAAAGHKVFKDDPEMSHQFLLGEWGTREEPSHKTYADQNPDYDFGEFYYPGGNPEGPQVGSTEPIRCVCLA
jgi:hypothetical protein